MLLSDSFPHQQLYHHSLDELRTGTDDGNDFHSISPNVKTFLPAFSQQNLSQILFLTFALPLIPASLSNPRSLCNRLMAHTKASLLAALTYLVCQIFRNTVNYLYLEKQSSTIKFRYLTFHTDYPSINLFHLRYIFRPFVVFLNM